MAMLNSRVGGTYGVIRPAYCTLPLTLLLAYWELLGVGGFSFSVSVLVVGCGWNFFLQTLVPQTLVDAGSIPRLTNFLRQQTAWTFPEQSSRCTSSPSPHFPKSKQQTTTMVSTNPRIRRISLSTTPPVQYRRITSTPLQHHYITCLHDRQCRNAAEIYIVAKNQMKLSD